MPCKRCGTEEHHCKNECIVQLGFCCSCTERLHTIRAVRKILKDTIYQTGDVYIDARTLDKMLDKLARAEGFVERA